MNNGFKFYYKVIKTKVDNKIRYQVNFFKTSDADYLKKQQYKLHTKYEEINDDNAEWVCDFITIYSHLKSNEKVCNLLDRILKGDYEPNIVMGELL